MRGGAIPILIWAGLLAVLMAICAIWTGEVIEFGVLAFAVLVIIVSAGAAVVVGGRGALARGEPQAETARPEPVPDLSPGSAIAAVGLGALLFGLVFGHFLVYFGAALMLVGTGRTAIELRAQRASVRRYRTHPRLGGDRRPGGGELPSGERPR